MKLIGLLAAVCVGSAAAPAAAQSTDAYPGGKPVTVVIPFSPGGPSDSMGRLFAQGLSEQWKVPVIVENRPGASGTIGGEFVRRSAPDGHTLLLAGPATLTILAAVNPRTPYDPVKDFAQATIAVSYPYVLVASAGLAKSFPDLLADLKSHPGKHTYASSGVGTTSFFMAELLKTMAGVDVLNVPYQGVAPGLNAVMAKQVSMMFAPINEVGPALTSGRVSALAVSSAERVAELPDVPAIAEYVKGYAADSWISLLAPAATPPAVLQKISTDLRTALGKPEYTRKLKELSLTMVASSPAQARASIVDDARTWRELARKMNIRLE